MKASLTKADVKRMMADSRRADAAKADLIKRHPEMFKARPAPPEAST